MKKRTKTILLALLALLILIQFFQIDKTAPESDPAMDFISIENPPPDVAELLKTVCYDCHSYKTIHPWYTNVQPIAWWINGHIKGARQHLNYSLWGEYEAKKRAHKMEEMVDEVKAGDMPLKSYTWIHEEARLTEVQRQKLVAWFESKQMTNDAPHDAHDGHNHD